MKKIIFILIALVSFMNTSVANQLTGDEIVQKINDVMFTEQAKATVKMTITTTSDEQRTFVYMSYMKDNGETNLIRYLKPRRVKGQAILMKNNANDIWSYFPRTKRVRKLATHAKRQKFEGSEFSYEDMGSGDTFITDFNSTRLEDEAKKGFDCYQLKLIRKKESDIGYSKLKIWARKDDFVPIVIEYYDDENPDILQKVLVQQDIQTIQGHPTAMKMEMHNEQDNSKTIMEFEEIDYNVELDDEMFTERGLKK